MLYQVDVGYACAGIVCEGDTVDTMKVVEAAPIYKWMVGKPFLKVMEWVNWKEGKIVKVDSGAAQRQHADGS